MLACCVERVLSKSRLILQLSARIKLVGSSNFHFIHIYKDFSFRFHFGFRFFYSFFSLVFFWFLYVVFFFFCVFFEARFQKSSTLKADQINQADEYLQFKTLVG